MEILIGSSVMASRRRDRELKVHFSSFDLVISMSKGKALLRSFRATTTLWAVARLRKPNGLEKMTGRIYHSSNLNKIHLVKTNKTILTTFKNVHSKTLTKTSKTPENCDLQSEKTWGKEFAPS